LRFPAGNVLAGEPPGEEILGVLAVHRSSCPNALVHLALPRNPASNAAKISRAPSSGSSCSQTSMLPGGGTGQDGEHVVGDRLQQPRSRPAQRLVDLGGVEPLGQDSLVALRGPLEPHHMIECITSCGSGVVASLA
jgi:hypothetical protein